MNISEKAAYIKGLMEGMKFNTETDEGKLIKNIVELLEDIALSVQDIEDETASMTDYIDELDHDLADLEEEVYSYSDEYDCDCDDDCCDECGDYDCCCEECEEDEGEEE
jgi:hypothetical protein